jgi:hypothetical protein
MTEAPGALEPEAPATDSGDGSSTSTLRERLVPPMPTDRLRGWVGTLLVTALAAVLRLWDLGKPHDVMFDETYYAKDAWSLLHFGYERTWVDKANAQVLAGNSSVSGPHAVLKVDPE